MREVGLDQNVGNSELQVFKNYEEVEVSLSDLDEDKDESKKTRQHHEEPKGSGTELVPLEGSSAQEVE